jgi:N-acetylglucosaminyl-diphospho-decaprenol L-rhamnosyltransferase
MDLSVVLVTFNSASCVHNCLTSVRAQLPGAEVVVVDNASADDTLRILEADEAKLISLNRNVGFGRACNQGADAATRSHLLFLNPDVVVTSADVAALEALFANRPFGMIGPKPQPGDGVIGPQQEPRLLDDWLHHTIGTLRPREWRQLPAVSASLPDEPWLSGSMLLVDRSEFLALRGFDPRFFLYYEDRDLAARYRSAGLPVRATHALRGTHIGTGSSTTDDLRVAPAAWAFLGWLEYVFIHRGERAARVSGRSAVTALRLVLAAVSAARMTRWNRADRKRRQLHALLDLIGVYVRAGGDDSFCPNARRLLRSMY